MRVLLLAFPTKATLAQFTVCLDTPFQQVKGGVTRIIPCGTVASGFGATLQLNGKWLFVAAPDGADGGSVFVYRYATGSNRWKLRQIIQGSGVDPGDQFGASMSYQAPYLVVGAPFDEDGVANSGVAYLFELDLGAAAFVERTIISAPDAQASAEFGFSVDLDTAGIVVGSPRFVPMGSTLREGMIYFFSYDAGVLEYRAQFRSNRGYEGNFGVNVNVENDKMIVQAENRALTFLYSFVGGHWIKDQKIRQRVPHDTDIENGRFYFSGRSTVCCGHFAKRSYVQEFPSTYIAMPIGSGLRSGRNDYGASIAVHKKNMVIGRPDASHLTVSRGGSAIWMHWEGGEWRHRFNLIPKLWDTADELGYEVDIGERIMVASSKEGDGAVYIVDLKNPELCIPPYNNLLSTVAPGSVALEWDPMPDATAYYAAIYRRGTNERLGLMNTSGASAVFTGLPIGSYYFRVASQCGSKIGERMYGYDFVITALKDEDVSKASREIPLIYVSADELKMTIPSDVLGAESAMLVDMNGRILTETPIVDDQTYVSFYTGNLPAAIYLVVLKTNTGLEAYKAVVP